MLLAGPSKSSGADLRLPGPVMLAVGMAAGFYLVDAANLLAIVALALSAVGITALSGKRYRPAPIMCALGILLGATAATGADSVRAPRLGLPEEEVVRLTGVLRWDSTAQGGKVIYHVDLVGGESDDIATTASGRLVVRADEGARGYWGAAASFTGVRAGRDGTWYAVTASVASPSGVIRSGRARVHAALLPPAASFEKGRALFVALTTGVKDDLDPAVAEAFRRAGCAHILALSGMHLGFVCAVPLLLLRRRVGRRKAALAAAVLAGVYVFVVGPKPSLLRAAVMYAASTVFLLRDARVEAVSILSVAFCILLSMAPEMGYQLSFQLSFLALFGVVAVAPIGARFLSRWIPPPAASALGAALGAQTATAGLVATTFGVLYPIGLVASIVLTPLVVLHAAAGIVALVVPSADVLGFSHDVILAVARFFAAAPSIAGRHAVAWTFLLIPVSLWCATAWGTDR